jgi:serine/threonine protein kinase/tetratricopeptide (TPR) repeat protein
MDDQRWRQIEDVYLAALDAPDRVALLAETCRDDPELLAAVEILLQEEPSTVSLFGRLTLDSLGAAGPPTRRAPLAPDSELGIYRIVELLGSGGSSDVYKAYDTRLDRHVALKVFDGTRVTEEFRSRFARESRAAASLNHPNIATVYDVGEADGCWFIAMEFIDGVTLRATFADASTSLRQRLEYLAQAASGVARAHANGIAHCDLKPENLMVTRDGLVKVLDFGLARLTGSRDATGPRFEGTLGYMSPEQVSGKPLHTSSDVFSFGCILFEAAVGRLPFPPAPRWIDGLMNTPAPRLETIMTSAVPAGLADLIDDCLEKDGSRRLPSLEDVSRRLQHILQQGSPRVGRSVIAAMTLVTAAIAAVTYWQWPAVPPAGSVAVIPFVTTDATPNARRLADELSEGVINALTQLSDLKVIARSSSSRFAGDSLDIPDVARTLGVRTLVTGKIVDINGRLRVRTELVSGNDGTVMWAADFMPSLANIADVESQIAREIASRVRSELTPADQRRLDRAVHPNTEAYSLLLRGRYEMSLYTTESAQRAASYFEQALGIDPSYALANAELANAYRFLATSGSLKASDALHRGEQAALRAVALDDELPEAHAALAGIRRDRWQWLDAEREYRRAIDLSPSFGPARQALAIALTLTRNDESAVAEITRARELDPVGLPGAVESAAVFYNLRQYDRARATLAEAATLDGLASVLWRWNGIVSGGSGDFVTAVSAFERAIQLGDTTAATRSYYVHALARAGRRAQARRELRALQRGDAAVAPSFLAIAYLGIGERERAIAQLQAGYAARDPLLQYIVVESYLDALMDDPRFKKIVDGMGLPQPRRS